MDDLLKRLLVAIWSLTGKVVTAMVSILADVWSGKIVDSGPHLAYAA